LIIVSYAISIYLLNICLQKTSLGEGLDVYSIYQSQYDEFNHPLLPIINNISYFNWLLILIIIMIITMTWRKLNYNYDIYYSIYIIILFNIMLYIFISIYV